MDDIEMTARIVLDEYYTQLARSFKHLKRSGLGMGNNDLDKAIFTIARRCVEHKFDPRHYVAVAMEILREPLDGEYKVRRLIKPAALATQDMMAAYTTRLLTIHGGDPEHRWNSQVNQLKRILLLNPQYTADNALVMFSFPFDNWFRVMYASLRHERIFKVYGTAAWDELREDRLLREYLRKMAPENMKELERRIAKFIESA